MLNLRFFTPRVTYVVQEISLDLLRETRIASTQTRVVPVRIKQSKAFHADALHISVVVTSSSGSSSTVLTVTLPILHHSDWYISPVNAVKASYFYAESMPTSFMVLPPIERNSGQPHPPILALR